MTPGKPAKLECFLPDLIDLTTNFILIGALFLIPDYWTGSCLGTKASLVALEKEDISFSLSLQYLAAKAMDFKINVHSAWCFSVTVDIQASDKDHRAELSELVPTALVCAASTFLPIFLEKMILNSYFGSHNPLCRALALNNNIGVKLYVH